MTTLMRSRLTYWSGRHSAGGLARRWAVSRPADHELGRRPLGFQTGSGDPLDGWQIETKTPDTVHLVVDLPVMHVDLIGHNDSARRRSITTLLTYRRPIVARLVWLVVGPAHRLTVRWLLAASRRLQPATQPAAPAEEPAVNPKRAAA